MYQVLLVTDQPDVRESFETFADWETLGFAPPRIVRTAKEAMLLIDSGTADAVAYVLPKDEGQAFFSFLAQHPEIRGIEAATDPLRLHRALSSLRRALHERAATDDLTDVLPILQSEFFHSLLEGASLTAEELQSRADALQVKLSLNSPVCLARLQLPQGEVYLEDVWRYGRARLEVALRNFFERDEADLCFVMSVLSPREIKLLACPKAAIDSDTLRRLMTERLGKAKVETLEFLELEVKVQSMTFYENLPALYARDLRSATR